MLKFRAVSFPLLLALLALMIFYQPLGSYIFVAAAILLSLLAFYELFTMLAKIDLKSYKFTASVIGTLIVGLVAAKGVFAIAQTNWTFNYVAPFFALVVVVPLCGFAASINAKDRAKSIRKMIVSLGGIWALVFPLSIAVFIYTIWSEAKIGETYRFLPWDFLYFVLVTKAMDTGGYIFGMLSNKIMHGGNHKIASHISPKKSVEGFIGGILLALAVSFVFYGMGISIFILSPWVFACAAVVLAFGSFFGDLTESAFKRAAGVKDSGVLIPGMGGILDVLDSFLYNGVLFILLKNFFQM